MGEGAIGQRVERHPTSQIVLDDGESGIAAVFTQHISAADVLDGARFDDALELHEDHGDVWQLVSIQAEPTTRFSLGDNLVWSVLRLAHDTGNAASPLRRKRPPAPARPISRRRRARGGRGDALPPV